MEQFDNSSKSLHSNSRPRSSHAASIDALRSRLGKLRPVDQNCRVVTPSVGHAARVPAEEERQCEGVLPSIPIDASS